MKSHNEGALPNRTRPFLPVRSWQGRRVIKFLRWAVIAGLIGLILYAFYQNRVEFGEALTEGAWGWLAFSLALNLVGSLVYVMVWQQCAQQLGATGGGRGALIALSMAGAARYVPGGIWPVAGLVYFAPQVGLSRRLMPLLAALAQLLHLLAAGLVAVLSFAVVATTLPGVALLPLLAAASLAFGLGLVVLWQLPALLARLLKPVADRLKGLKLGRPALLSASFWLLNGLRLWVMALTFGPTQPSLLPYFVWVGAVTTLLSALFFFVPLGLGVVELSLGWWLGLVLPWHQALVIVALNRLLRTANDAGFFGLALFLARRKSPESQSNPSQPKDLG